MHKVGSETWRRQTGFVGGCLCTGFTGCASREEFLRISGQPPSPGMKNSIERTGGQCGWHVESAGFTTGSRESGGAESQFHQAVFCEIARKPAYKPVLVVQLCLY